MIPISRITYKFYHVANNRWLFRTLCWIPLYRMPQKRTPSMNPWGNKATNIRKNQENELQASLVSSHSPLHMLCSTAPGGHQPQGFSVKVSGSSSGSCPFFDFFVGFSRGTIKFHGKFPSPAQPPLPLCTSQWQSPCVLCQIALHLVGSQPLKRQLTLKTPRIMPTIWSCLFTLVRSKRTMET